VWNKLDRLGIVPSGPADDAMFLRRVYLDTIGTLPRRTRRERSSPIRIPSARSQLIDRRLARDEYADFF